MYKRLILFVLFFFLFVPLVAAQQCVPPPQGIVAWWPGDNHTFDIVGTSHGILQNRATFGPGYVEQGFVFPDNFTDSVFVPTFNVSSPAFTFEGWVYAGGFEHNGNSAHFMFDAGLGRNLYVGWNSWRQSFRVYSRFHPDPWATPFFEFNEFRERLWYHYAYTYDGLEGRIYRNGYSNDVESFTVPPPAYGLKIGNVFTTPSPPYGLGNWNGTIDELSVYNRRLNSSEISAIAMAGHAGKCKSFAILSASPVAVFGRFSSHQLQVIGGLQPYRWSLAGGSLPVGVSIHANGIINGTPREAGYFNFTARVTDSNNTYTERNITLQVFVTLPPPQLRIRKTGTTAVPGRMLDYFIVVENIGNIPAQNVVVDEYVEKPLFNLTSTNPPAIIEGNESYHLELVSWNIPMLSPSEIKVFDYKVRLNDSTPIGVGVVGGPACVKVHILVNGTGQGSWRPLLPLPPRGYVIGSGFGCPILNVRPDHAAVDIKAAIGTPVTAVASGEVFYAREFGNEQGFCDDYDRPICAVCRGPIYGETVIIHHGNSEYTFYAHLSNIIVRRGQQVNAGEIIGYSGVSGSGGCAGMFWPGLGPHLHFAYFRGSIRDSDAVNPCPYLDRIANPEKCTCAPGAQCTEHKQNTTRPVDPNEKEVIANRFIQSSQSLIYPIHFENIGNVPALDVFVTDTLDRNLNFSTVQLLSPDGTFDSQTGNIRWNLLNINLEPNATGVVLFSAKPKQGLPSGTAIRNNATIQFEIFENVTTNTVESIIDDVRPSCTMNLLPNITASPEFTLSWDGADTLGEIDSFTVFAAIDNGPFGSVVSNTRGRNTTFIGETGRTYQFICIATDTAGNIEIQPPIAETQTFVSGASLRVLGIPRIGTTINLSASDLANPGKKYILALSFGTTPGIPLGDGRIIPLNPDILFLISVQGGSLIGLRNNINFLNEQGLGASYWDIPNVPELNGVTIYAAFVVLDHTLPIPFASISNAVPITIQ